MATISIEVRCDSHEQAEALTTKILNGNHSVGWKHSAWHWMCECRPDEILHLGQELHYELDGASDE